MDNMSDRPIVSLIVAMDKDGVIGVDNHLPWHLPSDLKRFRKLTIGKAVVMGRKTWESLPERFRPLPHRHNIVMSRNASYRVTGATNEDKENRRIEVCTTVRDVFDCVCRKRERELMVIGGGEIFREFRAYADRIYFTIVDVSVKSLASDDACLMPARTILFSITNKAANRASGNNPGNEDEWRFDSSEDSDRNFRLRDARDEYRTKYETQYKVCKHNAANLYRV